MSFFDDHEFQCVKCGLRTSSEAGKVQHTSEHRRAPRLCFFKNCGKTFSTESSLRRHLRTVHKLGTDFKLPRLRMGFRIVRRLQSYTPADDNAEKRKMQEAADAFYGKRPLIQPMRMIPVPKPVESRAPPSDMDDEWEQLLAEWHAVGLHWETKHTHTKKYTVCFDVLSFLRSNKEHAPHSRRLINRLVFNRAYCKIDKRTTFSTERIIVESHSLAMKSWFETFRVWNQRANCLYFTRFYLYTY